ncbi:MAG: NfeD family protein, partial [Caulobacter sp.]|nr:NfeD family protein [Caulobacter sp.]
VLAGAEPDLNDPSARLLGRRGEAVGGFDHGQGRVFVDGKEWAAVAQEPVPAAGSGVEVVAVDGATLTVRAV